jgi:hypothetical protein
MTDIPDRFLPQCAPFKSFRGHGTVTIGGDTLRIETSAGVVMFEWHPHCGPMPIKRNGSERELGPKHPFWRAVSLWDQQGKRIGPNDFAMWEPGRLDDEMPTEKELLAQGYVKVGRNLMPAEMHARLVKQIEAKRARRTNAKKLPPR